MSLSEKFEYKLLFAPHLNETQGQSHSTHFHSHGVNTRLCLKSASFSWSTVKHSKARK